MICSAAFFSWERPTADTVSSIAVSRTTTHQRCCPVMHISRTSIGGKLCFFWQRERRRRRKRIGEERHSISPWSKTLFSARCPRRCFAYFAVAASSKVWCWPLLSLAFLFHFHFWLSLAFARCTIVDTDHTGLLFLPPLYLQLLWPVIHRPVSASCQFFYWSLLCSKSYKIKQILIRMCFFFG